MKSLLEQIVQAVRYKGYIPYSYRESCPKNRLARSKLGRVCPENFSERENWAEPCAMQTECLLETAAGFSARGRHEPQI